MRKITCGEGEVRATSGMQVAEKLSSLRTLMAENDVDVLIVSNSDPHNNEYVAERWRCRQWVSHMKGSSGVVLITANWCGLWTDSRYYETAILALKGTEIELMRSSDMDTPKIEEWIKKELPDGSTVAFNGADTSVTQAEAWMGSLQPAGFKMRTDLDLIDRVWKDRPQPPCGKFYFVDEVIIGESVESKISRVREEMRSRKIDAHLLGRTDESCWLLNFRGTDIANNPTPYCFTLVTLDRVVLFVDSEKLGDDGRERLAAAGVEVCDYTEVENELRALDASTRLLLIPNHASHALKQAGNHCAIVKDRAFVTDLKGVKNPTEVANFKRILVEDGAAMVRFYCWIYETLRNGGEVTELSASRKLEACRAEIEGFRHVSFESIMGYGPDGALNHYSVDESSDKPVHQEGLFLIDSGGNFVLGTTDTTRVIPMGESTDLQKADYTLVLRGFIDLISLKFAEGATGAQLDGVCRQAMWLHGRNFKHGTGHGVGFGLEVHEGPQNISGTCKEIMKLGQISTIEPGCYRPGQWGIRSENMVHTVLSSENEFGRFFEFENLTFCPINVDLVEPSLLNAEHIAWLNAYNAEVVEKLSPLLDDAQQAWLKNECRPVEPVA